MTAAESFDAFVQARSRLLLRTAYLLTRDHALAEDLVQTAYGSSDLGSTDATVELSGLSLQASNNTGGGVATVGEAARGAGTASVKVSAGKATTGKLVLALYVPA